MSKIEDLKQEYLKDTDLMASKSRFGFFSILPNASAGIGSEQKKKIIKDQNGKVKTEQRNIFSGLTASGVLKKSYFNYETSVYQGDTYVDPGKHERQQKLKQSSKLAQKDVYKPLNLVKTPQAKSSYEHIPQKHETKTKKDYIDENGKIKTKQRNITTNSLSTLQRENNKKFKYIPDLYGNNLIVRRQQHQKSIKLRGQAPYKCSAQTKPQFYTYRQTYGTDQKCIKNNNNNNNNNKTNNNNKLNISIQHETKFKPSACKGYDTFSYPQYIPSGIKQNTMNKRHHTQKQGKQAYKYNTAREISKPCPSISLMKSNILRSIR